jgi:hypothetical protein
MGGPALPLSPERDSQRAGEFMEPFETRIAQAFALPPEPATSVVALARNLVDCRPVDEVSSRLSARVLQLAGGGRDLVGLGPALDELRASLPALADFVDASDRECDAWTRAVDALGTGVRRHASAANAARNAFQYENPVRSFLANARTRLGSVDRSAVDRLDVLAPVLLRALHLTLWDRVHERWAVALDRTEVVARECMYFGRYVSSDFLLGERRMSAVDRSIVDEAMRNATKGERKRLSEKKRDYLAAILAKVLRGERYDWREPTTREASRRSKGEAPERPDRPPKAVEPEVAEQLEEGAAPAEFEPAESAPELPAVGTVWKPAARVLARDDAEWLASAHTPETLALVMRRLEAAARGGDQVATAALALVIALVQLGARVVDLLDATIEDRAGVGDAGSIRYDPATACFVISPAGSGSQAPFSKAPEATDAYEPTEARLWIPASAAFADLVLRMHSRAPKSAAPLFVVAAAQAQAPRDFTYADLRSTLAAYDEAANEKLSPARTERACERLLRRSGLCPVAAAFVRGRVPRHTAAQGHYTRFDAARFEHRYLEALAEAGRALDTSGGPVAEALERAPSHILAPGPFTCSARDRGARGGYGSPLVPRREALAEWLDGLRAAAEAADDARVRHNCEMAYVAIAWMCLTGLRPDEMCRLTTARIAFEVRSPSVSVVAKANRRFDEWRSIACPRAAAALVERARRAHALVERTADVNADSADVPDTFVRMVRRDGAIRPLTVAQLGHFLRYGSERGTDPFRWKLNAPRHLYRTVAVDELGVPDEHVDALLGHATSGREALGVTSLVDARVTASWAERVSRHIACALRIARGEAMSEGGSHDSCTRS